MAIISVCCCTYLAIADTLEKIAMEKDAKEAEFQLQRRLEKEKKEREKSARNIQLIPTQSIESPTIKRSMKNTP